MDRDTVLLLPSGTEISIAAALGDLHRIRMELLNETEEWDVDFTGEVSDLEHVAELIVLLANMVGVIAE